MSLSWESIVINLQDNSVKQRLLGGEALLELAGHSSLSLDQFAEFVDLCSALLQDNNFKVAQQTLHALSLLVSREPDSIRPYANSIVPLIAERLGDARQQVRQDACVVLLRLLSVLRPDSVIPKLARFWTHRNWKVRHGLLQTMAEAVSKSIPGLIPPSLSSASTKEQEQVNYVITQVVNLVEDPNEAVRDASLDCLQELYRSLDTALVENLKRQNIRHAALKEVGAHLDKIKPCNLLPPPGSSDAISTRGISRGGAGGGIESEGDGTVKVDVNPQGSAMKPSSSKPSKPHPSSSSSSSNGTNANEDPSAPIIKISSERELAHEVEASLPLISSLTPEWTKRVQVLTRLEGVAMGIHAMQGQGHGSPLIEALNDATKQLRDPLAKQVEDRRSAVQKQACQTINALSLTLGPRFQDHAVHLLPEVIKVLPVSVLIMAQSADKCCLSLVATCHSHRMLAVLTHAASKDKNPKIRALCCGYVALAVERWEWSSLLRCSDEIEAVMRAAAQDANGEARQASKRLYLAYSSKPPSDTFNSFRSKLEPSIRDKLSKGVISRGGSVEDVDKLSKGVISRGGSVEDVDIGPKGSGRATQASSLPPSATATAAKKASRSPLAKAKALALASKNRISASEDLNEVVIFAPPPPSQREGRRPPLPVSLPLAAAPGHSIPISTPSDPYPSSTMGLPLRSLANPNPNSSHPPLPSRPRASSAFDLPPPNLHSHPPLPPSLAPYQQQQQGGSMSVGMKAGRKSMGGLSAARIPLPETLGASSYQAAPAAILIATAPPPNATEAAGGGGVLDMANLVHALTLNDLPLPAPLPRPQQQQQQGLAQGMLGVMGGGVKGTKPSRRSTGMMGLGLGLAAGYPYGGLTGTSLPFNANINPQPVASNSTSAAVRVPAPLAPAPAPQAVTAAVVSQAPAPAAPAPPQPASHPPIAALTSRQMISKVISDLLSGRSSSTALNAGGTAEGGASWSDRVEGMTSLGGLLSAMAWGEEGSEDGGGGRDQHPRPPPSSSYPGLPPQASLLPLDLCKEMERLLPKVTEWIDDSHAKVSLVALDLFHTLLKSAPRSISDSSPSQLDKVMPVLFQKAATATTIVAWSSSSQDQAVAGGLGGGMVGGGGREVLKAKGVLVEVLSRYPSDLTLGPLVKSLEGCKLPRAKSLVMEAAVHHLGVNKPSGPPSHPSTLKQWIKATTMLLGDKSPDVRKAALGAVEALYNGSWGDACSSLLSTFLTQSASGHEAVALKRAIQTLQEKTLQEKKNPIGPHLHLNQAQSRAPRPSQEATATTNVEEEPMQVEVIQPLDASHGRAGGGVGGSFSAEEYTSPSRFTLSSVPMEVDVHAPSVAYGSSSFGGSSSGPAPSLPSPSSVSDVTGFTFAPPKQVKTPLPAPAPAPAPVAVSAAAAAFLKLEPQAAARHVSLLAHRLLLSSSSLSQGGAVAHDPSSSQAIEGLSKLTDILKSAPVLACEALGPQLTLQLSQGVSKIAGDRSGSLNVREAAVHLSSSLAYATSTTSSSKGVQEAVVQGLLDASSDVSSKDLSRVAFEILGVLLSSLIPPERSVDLLTLRLPPASQLEVFDPNLLQVIIKCLTSVIGGFGRGDVKEYQWLVQGALLSRLVPGLVTSLSHSRADVRKAVVFCLVEVWLRARVEGGARETMERLLGPLTEAQKKLVEIYVQRQERN